MSNIKEIIDSLDLNNIVWDTRLSNKNSNIIYYSNDESVDAIAKLNSRIKDIHYNKIITNLDADNVNYLSKNKLKDLMYEIANLKYPVPKEIKSVAITGTNGKTTTVDLLRQLLIKEKKDVMTIGTMGVYLNKKKVEDFKLTSPHFLDFRKIIHEYKYEFLIVESSSHAISQDRQYKFEFDQIGFTSFSQDHLDYHKTMKEYFEAKMNLEHQCKSLFWISAKASNLKEKITRYNEYSFEESLENTFLNVNYNRINLDVALGVLSAFNIFIGKTSLESLVAPAGRLNFIINKDQVFVVDFAHTPDSLENVLTSLKGSFDKEIITVFGCGGNRDKNKRSLMGAISDKLSVFSIITTDNPRFEKREEIIDDIINGFTSKNYRKIINRRDAIKYAFENYKSHIILIAGKGHEEYIDEDGERIFFSDLEEVKKLIND